MRTYFSLSLSLSLWDSSSDHRQIPGIIQLQCVTSLRIASHPPHPAAVAAAVIEKMAIDRAHFTRSTQHA
uniref:Putative secreted protein n=1 Tax=Anopheles darlingi TaxID=43151 RepID=A0A2M4D271_ANODA